MKRLINFIIFCFCLAWFNLAFGDMLIHGPVVASVSCTSCTGTPDFFYDGEVTDHTDYAYYSDGCSSTKSGTVDSVDFGASYAYCGSVGMRFNAIGDDIRWAISSKDIFDSAAGTITMMVYVVSIAGDTKLFFFQNTAANSIQCNLKSDGTVYFARTGDSVAVAMTTTNTFSTGAWFELKFRWSVAQNKISVNIAGQGWEDDGDEDAVTAFTAEPANLIIGPNNLAFNSGGYYLDNINVETTYES